jgi:hypothetical protein
MKLCLKCHKTLDDSFFYSRRDSKSLRPYCKMCLKSERRLRYLNTKAHVLTKTKEWAKSNPKSRKSTYKKYREANRETINKKRILNYLSNPLKEYLWCKAWKDRNKEKVRFYAKTHQHRKTNRMPKWISKEQIKDMELVYRQCPKGYEVDHIIPLFGKNVSGLHVPENLQYLPKSENGHKTNKFNLVKIVYKDGLPVTQGVS